MRKAIAVLLLAALLTALFVPALAAEEKKLGNVVTGYEAVVSDDAGLLSDSEIKSVLTTMYLWNYNYYLPQNRGKVRRHTIVLTENTAGRDVLAPGQNGGGHGIR